MDKRVLRIVIKVAIAVMVLYAWLSMFFIVQDGVLANAGFRSLKFFTVLSNLFEAAVSLILAVSLLKGKDSSRLSLFNLIAACAVTLTLTVVVVFLGPLMGYRFMFAGANLWLHLIVPIAAIAEFILMNEQPVNKKKIPFVALSPLIYGCFYLGNNIINGTEGNDFYGFLLWGLPVGMLIFAVICVFTYLSGRILVWANGRVQAAKPKA